MEELTEVITAAEFHPSQCNVFVYSSSKGTIRLCDMRAAALCDQHAKCKFDYGYNIWLVNVLISWLLAFSLVNYKKIILSVCIFKIYSS